MTGHIFIYGEIGTQVTAKSVQDQIDNNVEDYEVHISSVGGDVYEGYAIYGILQGLRKPTTVVIEGLCASIATLIAQAGDKVVMTHPAEFMIHNPYVQINGDSAELIEAAGQLDRIKKTIISVYQKRTGLSADELSEMMNQETWLSADQAKQQRFVDDVQDKLKAVAFIDVTKIKMSKEKNSLSQILKDGIADLKNLITGTPKSMAMVTLEDGQVVTVGTESEMPTPEELVGATVVLENGDALVDGSYKTAEGVDIVVEGGIIISAVAPEAVEPSEPQESVEDLKAKIAVLEAELASKTNVAEDQANKIVLQDKTIKTFKASVEKLEAKYNELKDTTVGDSTPPEVGTESVDVQPEYDPMTEHIERHLRGRGILK